MIVYVNGVRVMCDYCYVRGPLNPNSHHDVPIKPPRWGARKVGGHLKHACPRHTRQLKAEADHA